MKHEILKNAGLLHEERDLMPGVSSGEDEKLRKQLKILFLMKDPDVDLILYRINVSRKAEGLEPLHKNEIMSSTLKKDIKKTMTQKKQEEIKKDIKDKKTKLPEKGGLKIIRKWEFSVGIFGDQSIGVKKDLDDDKIFNELVKLSKEVDKVEGLAICKYENNKFVVCVVELPLKHRYQLKVVGDAPKYNILALEVRFTELKKKIVARPNAEYSRWKIKRL